MLFTKVLIANRGEIAVRIIRGCQKMGYQTVAVYSDADAHALHVRLADQAVAIGGSAVQDSYLHIDKLIAAAIASGAGAIHPGYGFLSERADFASAVQAAGLIFIGPDPAAMAAMGNKSAAKQRMLAAGVPCIPGYQGQDQSDAVLLAEAAAIGYPLMIKAAAGGGGRGMRLMLQADDLAQQLASARSEALHAFGDGQLLLEKAVLQARHVEIQIFADRHGQVVHFGERDCSIQRRNQKVIEEAPSPAVNETLRAAMGAAAVAAARAVDYVGAGTVEFMLADTGEFYFLEMNTRLQVEHPVTELVYDVDLVEWQLRVAQGEHLPWSQEQILARRRGWAMEVRLCTEDTGQQFLPQTGTLLAWRPAAGRVDHGLTEGAAITPFYDSMQAKLIAWGETREQARRQLLRMLDDTVLLGVTSNRDFLRQLLLHPQFTQGNFSTGFIAEQFSSAQLAAARQPDSAHLALAACLLYQHSAQQLRADAALADDLMGWQSSAPAQVVLKLQVAGSTATLSLLPLGADDYEVATPQGGVRIKLTQNQDGLVHHQVDGVTCSAHWACTQGVLWLYRDGLTQCYADLTLAAAEKTVPGSDGRVCAPMDGKIMALLVKAGDVVVKGQRLALLEAMKMEFAIVSAVDGTVEAVHCQPGLQVKVRQLLGVITPGAQS